MVDQMFVVQAAVGTWLLTKILGRDAETGPAEEPITELPPVPTPIRVPDKPIPTLPITRPTNPVVAVNPNHVWIEPAVMTNMLSRPAFTNMINDIIRIDGKTVILIEGDISRRIKAVAEPTATDYALRLVIEQVKDAMHAKDRMTKQQLRTLNALKRAAVIELRDRGAPLSGLSAGRGTRRRSRIGNGGIGSLKAWHKDRIAEGRSADLNAMNREMTLIRMREGANIDTSKPVDNSGRAAVDHWKNHATNQQIAEYAPMWAEVEKRGIEISQEGHNVIIELVKLEQAQKAGLLRPADANTRGLQVLERVVEDILNNSKFVVGTYDVKSGGFPDVKVQRLSGINRSESYHNNLGSAFVKTRGVMGRLLGP